MSDIRSGIYPTMITPFTPDNQVDYGAVEQLVDFYAQSGCDGIFALCLSSEIFHLSDREAAELIKCIARANGGRMSLIASAHTAPDIDTQIRQLASMYENGAEQAVLILNRLATPVDGEEVVKRNAERIFAALPGVPFGVYECPVPDKRLASEELLGWLAGTGRVRFLKDTCCDIERIKRRLAAIAGTGLKLFNANTATLLPALRAGAAGFSGVMANFHPDLYAKLYAMFLKGDERADDLQAFLTLASSVESKLYPMNCKYHLRYAGIEASLVTRSRNMREWNALLARETDDLARLEQVMRRVFL